MPVLSDKNPDEETLPEKLARVVLSNLVDGDLQNLLSHLTTDVESIKKSEHFKLKAALSRSREALMDPDGKVPEKSTAIKKRGSRAKIPQDA